MQLRNTACKKEYIRALEEHCANVAQDNRRVESVAAEFYEEARRVHGLLPSLRSELHGLMSVRGALCGDLEHRVNQLRECESEVERLRSRTGGGVPAHAVSYTHLTLPTKRIV